MTRVYGGFLIFADISMDTRFKKTLEMCDNSTVEVGTNVLYDSELIDTFSDSTSILEDISKHCVFENSSIFIKEILTNFTNKRDSLWSRQEFFDRLDPRVPLLLEKARLCIDSAAWFMSEREDEVSDMLRSVFFRWNGFKRLNTYESALQLKTMYSKYVSPAIGICSPLLYFAMPLLIIRYKYGIKIPIKYYWQTLYAISTASVNQTDSRGLRNMTLVSYGCSIFFYCQGCYNSTSNAKKTGKICDLLIGHTRKLLELFDVSNTLTNTLKANPYYELTHELTPTVNRSQNMVGGWLHAFMKLDAKQDAIHNALNTIYAADAFNAIKKFIVSNHLNKASFDFHAKVPRYNFKGSWHVSIPFDKAVKNDSSNSVSKRNCIITGPNAAGKSTYVKSILVNVLLSQSIGYCASESAELTPFDYIGSQISIPDCKGKESLFEAEMYRSKENMSYIQDHPESKCIVFLDEIFNSTNPLEGLSGSHSIVNNLGKSTNAVVILTTHYDFICELNRDRYSLFKFECEMKGNEIIYNYMVREGVSNQFIALDILRINGFDLAVINEAQRLKRILLSTGTYPSDEWKRTSQKTGKRS